MNSTFSRKLHTGARILFDYRQYWRFNAFKEQPACLQALLKKLEPLNESALWELDNNPQDQAHFFRPYFPELFDWLALCEPEPSAEATPCAAKAHSPQAAPFWLHTDIPGRKWLQVQQFYNAIAEQAKGLSALEWCSGKGHLGRLYSWSNNQPVVSIEYNESLCAQGQKQAAKLQLPQHFINADIHQLPLSKKPSTFGNWLALHACGELHCEFLHAATQLKARHISLAPCCYHRQHASHYRPLSATAQDMSINGELNLQALRLAQQNQTTAGLGERKTRAQELNWRLGYEKLRQTLQPNTPHPNLPSLKKQAIHSFQAFCAWASQYHHTTLPPNLDWQKFESLGAQARLQMMRRDAIRHCFRRPLELWLALDKAVYLEEQGYNVRIQCFCEPSVSPRNLLLLANRDINAA